jgi:cytochrome c biogenesis protein ResB
VLADYPRARIDRAVENRSNAVKAEALHVLAQEGAHTAEAWLGANDPTPLSLGDDPLQVEYRPAEQQLPFGIKLLDFRKTDYPGTTMAAGFESDVELTDPQRGVVLLRKISMNNPLRYRGYSFYQSSYIPGPPPTMAGAGEGPVETTVLSVRNDPGTPFVYAGFLIVMAGVVGMFIFRRADPEAAARPS